MSSRGISVHETNHVLIQVWCDSVGDLFWYQPSYRIPPAREAEESTPAGRLRNKDGSRWKEQVGRLERQANPMILQCQHCKMVVSSASLLTDADEASLGNPIRRRV